MPVLKSETRIKQINTTDPATDVNEYASGDIVYEEGKGFKRHNGSAFVGIQSEFDGMFINTGIAEKLTQNGATSSLSEEYDCADSQVFFNSSTNANWRVNLINFSLGLESATNVVIIVQQDATPYYPSSLLISATPSRLQGSLQTIHWAGGEAPVPTENGIDVFSFTIFKLSNNNVHYVLGQLVPFKGIG